MIFKKIMEFIFIVNAFVFTICLLTIFDPTLITISGNYEGGGYGYEFNFNIQLSNIIPYLIALVVVLVLISIFAGSGGITILAKLFGFLVIWVIISAFTLTLLLLVNWGITIYILMTIFVSLGLLENLQGGENNDN